MANESQMIVLEQNNIWQNNTNSDFPVAIIVEDSIQQSSFTTSEEAC